MSLLAKKALDVVEALARLLQIEPVPGPRHRHHLATVPRLDRSKRLTVSDTAIIKTNQNFKKDYRSWIRDMLCTQHLKVLGSDSKTYLTSRLLAPL